MSCPIHGATWCTCPARGTSKKTGMQRASWLGAPAAFNLNMACLPVSKAFGCGSLYLVGSCLEKRDYRDVDIRCILADEDYDKWFPGQVGGPEHDPRWSLLCAAISEWLSSRTGLPIDFQIQKRTQANEKFSRHGGHKRHPTGFMLEQEAT